MGAGLDRCVLDPLRPGICRPWNLQALGSTGPGIYRPWNPWSETLRGESGANRRGQILLRGTPCWDDTPASKRVHVRATCQWPGDGCGFRISGQLGWRQRSRGLAGDVARGPIRLRDSIRLRGPCCGSHLERRSLGWIGIGGRRWMLDGRQADRGSFRASEDFLISL
jgi:hypothetical protein